MTADAPLSRASSTPVMLQYREAKQQHPDALLFFRLGDFYELFFEDAVVAARALDLTLTSRNKGSGDEIPMAGVPHHAASSYLQRLLDQGFKVALCEQMADPATIKGICPRQVVRVVTPAFPYDDTGLHARRNSFVVAVDVEGGVFGLAALDLSTGELSAGDVGDADQATSEVLRLDPREILLGPGTSAVAADLERARPEIARRIEAVPMEERAARRLVEEVVGKGAAKESGVGLAGLLATARALAFARACEPMRALPVSRLARLDVTATLLLDDATQAHLELVRTVDGETQGSLLSVLDHTSTAFGARLLRRRLLAPLVDVAQIRRRLDLVEAFVTEPRLRGEVRAILGRVADVERIATRLATGRAAPRDLVLLRAATGELPELKRTLCEIDGVVASALLGGEGAAKEVDTLDDVRDLLCRGLADDPPPRAGDAGVISEGFDAELDASRTLATEGAAHIARMEAELRESSRIGSLKLKFTRVFGWYIEVTRSHLSKVPRTWRRKQTISTGERYTTPELDLLAEKLLGAQAAADAREAELFRRLTEDLAGASERIRRVAQKLAAWDVAATLAEVAHLGNFARPHVDDSLILSIEDGRHAVVERLAAAGRFVPNDVSLDGGATDAGGAGRLWLITGPNMAGKSTFMRQVAILAILAQMGSFVPARRAHVGVVDRVLTRVGASDNLSKGESTFMVEMKETANILRRATPRSLVGLDESGRGPSTYDGLSIAWAVAENLHDVVRARALFATHYHELTRFVETAPFARNHSVSARVHAGDIVFFHRVEEGAASRSYGVACARLAGLPEAVLSRAQAILDGLETKEELPTGALARGTRRAPQLSLFGERAEEPAAKSPEHPALAALRELDPDRMTPLDALLTLSNLRRLAKDS